MKERKSNISTDGGSSPTLEDMVSQITPDNTHPIIDDGELGQEVTEYDEDEELKNLIKDGWISLRLKSITIHQTNQRSLI